MGCREEADFNLLLVRTCSTYASALDIMSAAEHPVVLVLPFVMDHLVSKEGEGEVDRLQQTKTRSALPFTLTDITDALDQPSPPSSDIVSSMQCVKYVSRQKRLGQFVDIILVAAVRAPHYEQLTADHLAELADLADIVPFEMDELAVKRLALVTIRQLGRELRRSRIERTAQNNAQFIDAYVRDRTMLDLLIDWYTPLFSQPFTPVPISSIPTPFPHIDMLLSWPFNAFDLSYDDLLMGCFTIFKHVLSIPELAVYRISDTRLLQFLCLIRSTYHTRAAYHNFRHAVDVLQAVYFWLLTSRLLPPHPSSSSTFSTAAVQPPFNILLPKNLLAICLAAIGHDAGHPGLTNAFLIGAKSSLAKIYNDHSVLESLHAMVTTRLISQVWPQIFDGDADDETGQKFRRGGTGMRKLIVEMILSTDMGLHFEFMEKFTELRSKLQNKFAISNVSAAKLEEYRTIILCLCLKCADISNVVNYPLVLRLFY